MNIKSKKIFAIIGKPIEHSLSPTLHNYWFNKYEIDANYSLLHVDEEELESCKDFYIYFTAKWCNKCKQSYEDLTNYLNNNQHYSKFIIQELIRGFKTHGEIRI